MLLGEWLSPKETRSSSEQGLEREGEVEPKGVAALACPVPATSGQGRQYLTELAGAEVSEKQRVRSVGHQVALLPQDPHLIDFITVV